MDFLLPRPLTRLLPILLHQIDTRLRLHHIRLTRLLLPNIGL